MIMSVQQVYDDGLCMQCGTCAPLCAAGAIALEWDLRTGYRVAVSPDLCTDCGACLEVCPGPGIDFGAGAWWRERNAGADSRDFLGPWRSLWFGWASDPRMRHEGASGGVATALLAGALESGAADAVLAVGLDPHNPLSATGILCHTPQEVAACRGSKYNVVAVNTLLRYALDEPGRYVLVGLPCHIQGLRLAQRRSRRLRERVVLALGIFCGLTNEPHATEVATRQAGLDTAELRSVRYRGPGWPGGMHLESRDGLVRYRDYPDYYDRYLSALVPPRCRICPDALAELADVSVGDAWLARFDGSDGVSDLVVRTPAGERLMADLSGRLSLIAATPDDMVASQRDARRQTRPLPRAPLAAVSGSKTAARLPRARADREPAARAARQAAQERFWRSVADRRWPV